MQIPVVLPLVIGRVHHGLVAARAGVVDEDVDAVEVRENLANCAVTVVGAAHIGGNTERAHAVLGVYLSRALAGARAVARDQCNMHALGGQPLRNGETNAHAAARYNCDFALQLCVHGLSHCFVWVALQQFSRSAHSAKRGSSTA